MKIKWLGHSCFLITSDPGLKIITDPYDVDDAIHYGRVKEQADIVTISHQHSDHNNTGDMPGKPEIVEGPGRQTVRGIVFEGIASYHDPFQGRKRGDNIIFCFNVDGIRLCHCGDLGHRLDDAALKALGKVDILMIPAGGPPQTMELDEAVEVSNSIKPSVLLPMHYKNERCSFPKYGAKDIMHKWPNAQNPGKSELGYSKGNLPSQPVVILLDHAL
jgi:L-ascorbate metabolism protein UlaG (beta-lactamase superfamily)